MKNTSDKRNKLREKLIGLGKESMHKSYYPQMVEYINELEKAKEELKKHQLKLEDLIKERTKELEEKNEELERMNQLFVGREFRIKELKDKVNELNELLKK